MIIKVSSCIYYWMISHFQVHSICAALGRIWSWGLLAYKMHSSLLWDHHHLHISMIYGFVKFRAQWIILSLLMFTEGLALSTCYSVFVLDFLTNIFTQRLFHCIYNSLGFFFPNPTNFRMHSLLMYWNKGSDCAMYSQIWSHSQPCCNS